MAAARRSKAGLLLNESLARCRCCSRCCNLPACRKKCPKHSSGDRLTRSLVAIENLSPGTPLGTWRAWRLLNRFSCSLELSAMKSLWFAAGSIAAMIMVCTGSASAQQSGLAGMHDQYVSKGRRCFSGHTHVGTGSPAGKKRQAIASAAQDWSSFTALEYGSSWASWRIATGKTISCEQSSRGWTCEVQARPCLRGRAGRARHAKR